VSEAHRIAEVDRYGHSSRDGRHERKIVRQLEQVGNRQGESNIAVKRDILLFAAARLCTPLARRACFVVKDANGFAVSYVYYESEPARRSGKIARPASG
jgi:hypothetical protein